jgi:hypothetical protein
MHVRTDRPWSIVQRLATVAAAAELMSVLPNNIISAHITYSGTAGIILQQSEMMFRRSECY